MTRAATATTGAVSTSAVAETARSMIRLASRWGAEWTSGASTKNGSCATGIVVSREWANPVSPLVMWTGRPMADTSCSSAWSAPLGMWFTATRTPEASVRRTAATVAS